MTLFHFGNCIALAYFPYFILYKCSGLSEYSAFWRCVKAGGAYLFTQLCKMLVLATFFPPSESTQENLDVFGDLLKGTVDLADLVGLYIVMNGISGKGELKVLVAGVGWASAELVMTRLLPLWVGARGVEFDWKYLQMSFDANISLVQHITTATLVWLWTRHDLQKSHLPFVIGLMVASCFKPVLIEIISFCLGIHSWSLLAAKALFTSVVGVIALQFYITLTTKPQRIH